MRRLLLLLLPLLGSLLGGGRLAAQADSAPRSRNEAAPAFRIIDNIYYVGGSGVASYLITTPGGHILIDGGYVETAPMIVASIRELGFRIEDVRYLLNSHAHFDHAGGLAQLKRLSGARLVASERDGELLRRGGAGDFTGWADAGFPAVATDRIVRSGDSVRLGGTSLVAHLTPGHTKGCTTWTTAAADGERRHAVVFHCSTSVPGGYRLVGNDAYPRIAADYAATFQMLRALPCEVFLAPHPAFFRMADKRDAQAGGAMPNPFIDPAGCAAYLDASEAAFRAELARQRR